MTEIVNARMADPSHAVLTLEGSGGACARPCRECPWRRENVGRFPAEAFRISTETAHDAAMTTFACHMVGVDSPKDCAGALLSTGAEHNIAVRLKLMTGRLRWEDVDPAGADLFPSYREMAEANGVDPCDPALENCR